MTKPIESQTLFETLCLRDLLGPAYAVAAARGLEDDWLDAAGRPGAVCESLLRHTVLRLTPGPGGRCEWSVHPMAWMKEIEAHAVQKYGSRLGYHVSGAIISALVGDMLWGLARREEPCCYLLQPATR